MLSCLFFFFNITLNKFQSGFIRQTKGLGLVKDLPIKATAQPYLQSSFCELFSITKRVLSRSTVAGTGHVAEETC